MLNLVHCASFNLYFFNSVLASVGFRVNNAFLKMRKYESSGYYQHDSMIWTFETGNHPLNIKEVRKMIAKLKQKFGY